jgi:hypothetical protein
LTPSARRKFQKTLSQLISQTVNHQG